MLLQALSHGPLHFLSLFCRACLPAFLANEIEAGTDPFRKETMKHAVMMLVCAFALSACGMFKSEPKHLTTPAQWEKYGYHDHLHSDHK